jgi:hypothetical protein
MGEAAGTAWTAMKCTLFGRTDTATADAGQRLVVPPMVRPVDRRAYGFPPGWNRPVPLLIARDRARRTTATATATVGEATV